MSYGQVVHTAVGDRAGQARQLTEAQHESQQRTQRAADLIRERLPDLVIDDDVCDWAVWCVLELWHEHGEGNVKPSQVRALHKQRVSELIARLGWNPWTQEGPDDQQ